MKVAATEENQGFLHSLQIKTEAADLNFSFQVPIGCGNYSYIERNIFSGLPRDGKLFLPKRELCLQREFEFADLVQQKCAAPHSLHGRRRAYDLPEVKTLCALIDLSTLMSVFEDFREHA